MNKNTFEKKLGEGGYGTAELVERKPDKIDHEITPDFRPSPNIRGNPAGNSIQSPVLNNGLDWRTEVNQELREHLVKKVVLSIFPAAESGNSNDDRIKKLYTWARKNEEDFFTRANTREEYYHMLAEKIYKIQQELEEKRKDTTDPQMPQQSATMQQQPNPNELGGMAKLNLNDIIQK